MAGCGGTDEVPARDDGAGGTTDAGDGMGTPSDCVRSEMPSCPQCCGCDALMQAVCEEGEWTCPAGSVDSSTCSPDICQGPPPGTDFDCVDGEYQCPEAQVAVENACLEATCENRVAGYTAYLDRLLQSAMFTLCETDDDCAMATVTLSCIDGCDVAVKASYAPDFGATLERAVLTYCSAPGEIEGCGVDRTTCVERVARCMEQRCVAVDPSE